MADRIIEILTPAVSTSLITLDEAKLMMGLALTDPSEDQQLSFWCDVNSETVARMCNRVFAREEVREEWRELNGGPRIFPSHWPIKQADIISVESPPGTVIDPGNPGSTGYELEEESGKIEIFGTVPTGYPSYNDAYYYSGSAAWVEPVVVHYWGGYNLPNEAPLPLKRAVSMLNLQSKLLSSLGTIAGLRALSHKEARVMFHDPSKLLSIALGGKGAAGIEASIWNLLSHYAHLEV
jgi:hypothetical protein